MARSIGTNLPDDYEFALILALDNSLLVAYNSPSGSHTATASDVLVRGDWQYIVFTYSASEAALRVYVDGEFVHEGPVDGPLRLSASYRTCLGNSDIVTDGTGNEAVEFNGTMRDNFFFLVFCFISIRWNFSLSNVSWSHERKRSATTLF